MKKSILILSFLFCFQVYGIKTLTLFPTISNEDGFVDKKEPLKSTNYTIPAAIDTKGKVNITVSGSFLYWKIATEAFDSLYIFFTDQDSNPIFIKNIPWKFDYTPAFKVSLGMNFPKSDGWQLQLEYLRYHYSENLKKKMAGLYFNSMIPGDYPFFYKFPSNNVSSADLSLKSHFETMQLTIGRPSYLGKSFIFNPYCGLKVWWAKNHLSALLPDNNYNNVITSIKSHLQNEIWAVGLRAGMDVKFLAGKGFNFFAKSAFNLLYQSMKIYNDILGAYANSFYTIVSKDKRDGNIPGLEIGLGAAWGSYLFNKQMHLDLALGYDFIAMWGFYIRGVLVYVQRLDFPNREFYFHGLTATATLDF